MHIEKLEDPRTLVSIHVPPIDENSIDVPVRSMGPSPPAAAPSVPLLLLSSRAAAPPAIRRATPI